jgi:hypothetical protein
MVCGIWDFSDVNNNDLSFYYSTSKFTSREVLLVRYTWLADVNASVAKCLCF